MFTESESSAGQIGASRRGRRRRMLAIQSAVEPQPLSDGSAGDGSPLAGSQPKSAVEKVAEPGKTPRAAVSPSKVSNDGERIRELIEDVQPRTWVFAGDNLGFQVEQARRGWIEHFSDFIRERVQRSQDIILNSSFAHSTVEHLLRDVDWRILRFQPDVVLLMPSPEECAQRGNTDEFRDTLSQLTDRLHEEGCTVVLNTPPCPANASFSDTKAMKTAASRVRAVASQTGAVLADHSSHWQATIEHDGSNANLHTESGEQPSARGHRELARRLLKSLDIRTS